MSTPLFRGATLVAFWILPCTALPAPEVKPGAAPLPRMEERHRAFFKSYCTECHNAEKQKGQVRLDDLSFVMDSVENADRWQKILNQINSGEMPPEDSKQPERGAKTEFLDALSRTLMTARRTLGDSGGKITMRRLNLREYKNTLRDLLGVEVNPSELPVDGGAGTFDTIGSSLFMSPDQVERYLVIGRQALEESFARYGTAPSSNAGAGNLAPTKLHVEAEDRANKLMETIVKTNEGAMERYQQWTAAVDRVAAKPENAALVKELRELPVVKTQPFHFYTQWQKRNPEPSPKTFKFSDADEAEFLRGQYRKSQYAKDYLRLPHRDTGAFLTIGVFNNAITCTPNPKSTPGSYILRIRIGATKESPKERRFLQLGQTTDVKHVGNFSLLSTHQISGTIENPEILEIPVTIGVNDGRSFAVREKVDTRTKGYDIWMETLQKTGTGPVPALWIDWMELEGPLKDPAQARIQALLTVNSEDRLGARKVIERFAIQAFRHRAPSPEYLEKVLGVYEMRIKAGDKFQAALKEALSVVLASSQFLYLSEPTPEDKPRLLNGLELATRLSYFLWSAPPDETLLALVRTGALGRPEVLVAQVDRMLHSEKSREFVTGFTKQWLRLDRLDFFQFNTQLYREFDDSTKDAAREEVFQTIEHLLRSNGSLRDLLKADYVIVNGLLAQFYGLEGVTGDAFRKVPLPKDSPRGGLLGMAAIMAMGSNGEHSSPVERGAWVLRYLLNNPPPPAPPNVPQITRLNGQLLTTRERLLAHQEQPQCASCHRAIDPIGFGLENFNAIGKWRTEDTYQALDPNGKPIRNQVKTWNIDASAAFHKGPAFKNYFELRNLIASRPDLLARGFTENLIAYALGRPFGFTDEALANTLVQRALKSQFAMREFVQALVASKEFHSK
ncbi:MAG: hypothetical protein RLZZ142_1148 [Verrucomicrobiota bacterium]